MTPYPIIACTLVLAALATPAPARVMAADADPTAIALPSAILHPANAPAARRAAMRIERTALAVCGATNFSLREVTRTVRASSCWREAMAGVDKRIADPLLRRAWQDRFGSEIAR